MQLNRSGAPTGYRDNTLAILTRILSNATPNGQRIESAIDVGAGEGWYARQLIASGTLTACTPVDIKRRDYVELEPLIYDGERLPFPDRHFQLAYTIDVAHHAPRPLELLSEVARVADHWILIKDHTYTTHLERAMLIMMDEAGNRRFRIPSPGLYQRAWEWIEHISSLGFVLRTLQHPAPCHGGRLGKLTNHLQFVALLERHP